MSAGTIARSGQFSSGDMEMLMVNQDSRELFIYDDIGPSWAGMVGSEDVVRALGMLGSGPVSVRINSPGGSVFEGYAIYNALKRHDGKVTTYNDGLAASAASIVFLSGEERVASNLSMVMIHEAATIAFGNANDFIQIADLLEKINGQIADLYVGISGKDKQEILEMMNQETWLDYEESKSMAFVTNTANVPNVDRKIVPQNRYKKTPQAYLKPAAMLSMVKHRPNAEKEKRYEKLFNLTGVDLRVK
jgi:ATP-dependent Clp protease protease subunit